MSDRQFIADLPQEGMMYHRLTALIASNYSGLGPGNVASNPYRHLVGQNFQKPLSGVTPTTPTVPPNHMYR
jgi:hypothetical protein